MENDRIEPGDLVLVQNEDDPHTFTIENAKKGEVYTVNVEKNEQGRVEFQGLPPYLNKFLRGFTNEEMLENPALIL